ncbi:hypothetical protein FOA52_004498 [Chlamydomonas sp. UWO 241]|nr:hypothetical protein FOA52_004498 [Chlamydomonas sp. UWO 241]
MALTQCHTPRAIRGLATQRCVHRCRVVVARAEVQKTTAKICIIGSGPAAHTAAIYAGRADLAPLVFEGWMANGIAPGGQLTTTSYIENFPGFVEPVLGIDLTDNFRKQSVRYGAKIVTETVTRVDLSARPFKVFSDSFEVDADTVIVASGASARRLGFPGADKDTGYWGRGISACAICDGSSPMVRGKRVGVIGGGDTACEEATFLTRYAEKVFMIHRFDTFEASKIMQNKALKNPKIEVLWQTEVVEAHGDEMGLTGVKLADKVTGEVVDMPLSALFFAIGHRPATDFLDGQLELDESGFIRCVPDSTETSVRGVFAAGDVMDPKFMQAVVAAGSGCRAALEAERFLQAVDTGSLDMLDDTSVGPCGVPTARANSVLPAARANNAVSALTPAPANNVVPAPGNSAVRAQGASAGDLL